MMCMFLDVEEGEKFRRWKRSSSTRNELDSGLGQERAVTESVASISEQEIVNQRQQMLFKWEFPIDGGGEGPVPNEAQKKKEPLVQYRSCDMIHLPFASSHDYIKTGQIKVKSQVIKTSTRYRKEKENRSPISHSPDCTN